MLPSSGYALRWTVCAYLPLCWNTQCAGHFSGRGATPRPSHSVFEDTDLHCVGIRNVQGFSRVKVHHPGRAILHTHPHRQGWQEHSSWDNSHCQGSVFDAELQLCWDTQLQGFSWVKVQHPGQAIYSLNFGTTVFDRFYVGME